MSTLAPQSRPRLTREEVENILNGQNPQRAVVPSDKWPVRLLGVRGYYRSTLGDPKRNDRGIYDDALFIDCPALTAAFNANVDPSAFRNGIANLNPGLWWYQLGIHGLNRPKAQQYQALVQAAQVTVTRDEEGSDTGWFGINIHRGGWNTTSSLGCQTIPPDQWESFIAILRDQLKRHGQKRLPYLLIDGPLN